MWVDTISVSGSFSFNRFHANGFSGPPGKGQPPQFTTTITTRGGASRHVITLHVKTESTCYYFARKNRKLNLAAASHAIVFDECTAIPIATIAMSDYGQTNDTPGKG